MLVLLFGTVALTATSCASAGEDEPAGDLPSFSIRGTTAGGDTSDGETVATAYTYSTDNPETDVVNLDGGGFTVDWHNAVEASDLSEKNVVSYDEMPSDVRANEEFEYDVYEDHVVITKYVGSETTVTVPAELDGLPVTQIGGTAPNSTYDYEAFRGTRVQEVIISEGITTIGGYAFSNCGQLQTIVIPESVSSIGMDAFGDGVTDTPWYRSLKESGEEFVIVGDGCLILYNGDDYEVTVPDGVKGIFEAFRENEDIEEVTLPDSVTQIVGGFYGCTYLRRVNLPESMTVLGRNAFEGCTALREMELPAGLKKIDRGAFFGCTRLKSIVFGGELESIGTRAFGNCTSITAVEFPESLLEIGEKAFDGCTALTEVRGGQNVEKVGAFAFADTPWLKQQTDYFVAVGKNVLIKYNGSDSEVRIPDTVTYIGGAFGKESGSTSDSLKKVVVPAGVRGIAGDSFCCRGVTEIVLEGNTTVCEANAFSLCGLETIHLPEGMTVLAGGLFSSSNLQEVELPEGILFVGENAFGVTELQTVVIPESVISIGSNAFCCCENLEDVYIPASVTRFGEDIFDESPKVTIHGESGSAAEAYAAENGIAFEAVSSSGDSEIENDETENGEVGDGKTGNVETENGET
ncbi:MAG: leucine-rich repeat domain-containing protein [Lachnospiraceae bacterium]|nr:leucine-rich repeat domain-containing protein [Lachnospiraceae bacterium]